MRGLYITKSRREGERMGQVLLFCLRQRESLGELGSQTLSFEDFAVHKKHH